MAKKDQEFVKDINKTPDKELSSKGNLLFILRKKVVVFIPWDLNALNPYSDYSKAK